MSHTNITTASTTQCATGACKEALISVNNGWTGTIVVIDGTTGTTANVATITNPVTGGSPFQFRDFINGVRIITTGTVGDITVSCNTGSIY